MRRRVYIGTASTPAAATVDTAGQGYFVAVQVHPGDTINGTLVGTIDKIRLTQFVLPFRVSFNRIGTKVTVAGGASKKYGVALFDKDLNLLVQTGALDANTQQVDETTVALTTIEPGIYWVGQTSDSTSTQCTLARINATSSITTALSTPRSGLSSTTATSPGVFPSTVAAPAASSFDPIVAIFSRE